MSANEQANVENQEFGLQKLDPTNLSELKEFEKSQKQLVEDHPFVEITDPASYKEAKKNRTALKTGRTTIEKQDRTIGSVVSSFRKGTKAEAERLIAITQPHEEKQQAEIDRHEAILQAEKDHQERIEQERIDGIKQKIEDMKLTLSKSVFEMEYEDIEQTEEFFEMIVRGCENEFDFMEFKFLFDEMVQEQRTALKATKTNLEEEHKQKLINERVDEYCAILELDGYLLNPTSDVYEKRGFEISKSAMVKMTINDLKDRMKDISGKIAKVDEQNHQQKIQDQKNRIIEVREGLLDIVHQMDLENEEESKKYIVDSINKNSNENKHHYDLVIEEYNKAVKMVESALNRKLESLQEDRKRENERIEKEMEIFVQECQRRHEVFAGLGFECEEFQAGLIKKFKGFGMEYTSEDLNSIRPDLFDDFIQQTKQSIETFKENDKKEKERQERLVEDKDKIENFLIDFPIYFSENQIFDNLKNEESKNYFKTIEREFMNLCKTFKNDLKNI